MSTKTRVKPPRCLECGKYAYAQTAAIGSAIRRSKRAGHGLRVYACPHGNGWHLTKRKNF